MRFLTIAARLAPVVLLAGALPAQQRIRPVTPADINQQVEFDIYLPLQNAGQLDQLLADLQDPNSPNYQRWLTPQEFHQRFGPSAADLTKIGSELSSRGLSVVRTHGHGMRVRGSVAAIQTAFGAPIWNDRAPNGASRLVAARDLKLPASLVQAGAQVLAFSPVIRMRSHAMRLGAAPDNRYSAAGPYWFDDLKQAYDFPSYLKLTGAGRTIGIVMASDFSDSDLALYFGHEHLAPPTVVHVPVDGGSPFDPNSSFEVSLDVQQSGGMAPGATIVDFNTPDLSDQSIYDAYYEIVESNAIDIVSSSFGGAEGLYTAAYNGGVDFTGILRLFDDLFKQGNAQGITFIASSGDEGGLGLPSLSYFLATPKNPPVVTGEFLPGIQQPASSPHVTAVGGTNLTTTYRPPSLNSAYVRENADDDRLAPYDPYGVGNLASGGVWQGGGGVSVVFSKPAYQYLVRTGANMRTIPDISGHMGGCPFGTLGTCPADRSSVVTAVGGSFYLLIGTSASAPDFAGILALAEQNLGRRLGNVNYLLYGLSAVQRSDDGGAFHQGIPGDNGLYVSHGGQPGYNLVVGNGTPLVRNLILAPFVPPAGIPQTPSNP